MRDIGLSSPVAHAGFVGKNKCIFGKDTSAVYSTCFILTLKTSLYSDIGGGVLLAVKNILRVSCCAAII